MMDVLSDVLGTARLHGTVYGSLELANPWGLSAGPRDQFIFHIIARGRAWFEVADSAPIHVSAGDVLLLAPRKPHSLRDALDSKLMPIERAIGERIADPRPPTGDPGVTQIVCGAFTVDDEALLSALPAVIHTHELASDAGPWLAQTAKLLAFESCGDLPGGATIASRVCDALFVYVIRSVLAKSDAVVDASWLRALVTPKIGDALRLVHGAPSKEWSVAELAQRVGMSRSAFAERFTEVVGQSPMQYVIGWRVRKAASILRGGDAGLAEVAAQVGYQSEVAFAKAFKREMGVAPGAYRKTAQAAQVAAR
jgi:AraC-like DNA-binding protein